MEFASVDESIWGGTPKKLIQKVFWRILVDLTMLNNILKVYRVLTSGKGSFSRWRPRWLLGSYNDYISKTIQRRKLVMVSKRRFWAQGSQYNQCKYSRLIFIDKSKMASTQMAPYVSKSHISITIHARNVVFVYNCRLGLNESKWLRDITIGSIFIDIFKIACLEVAQFTHYIRSRYSEKHIISHSAIPVTNI